MEADPGHSLLEPETRSSDPAICPFLRALDGDRLVEPVGRPDDGNRCLATGPAVAQDLEWQASTCLASAHVTCARYLSGSAFLDRVAPTTVGSAGPGASLGTTEDPDADASVRQSRTMTPAIVLSLVLLVASATAAITFVGATGGLQLPTTAPSPVALASGRPTASAAGSQGATTGPTTAPTRTETPSPAVTSEPTALATPSATLGPTPAPTSSRYALLEPCPSKPNCYLYTVRSGDNLSSIANYFGVPYDTVLALNPTIRNPSTIQPGTVLTLPPPTR